MLITRSTALRLVAVGDQETVTVPWQGGRRATGELPGQSVSWSG
ncbi:hypothetical protein [Streptomyces sp. NBC_01615]